MTTTDLSALLDTAGEWADTDPDPRTQEELRELILRVRSGDAAV